MKNLATILSDFCQEKPQDIAITLHRADQPDKPLTYGELTARANDYAQAYARAGIQPGELIILILEDSEQIIYAFWGAILFGAAPSIMPFLTETFSPERYRTNMSALFNYSRPNAIVTEPDFEAICRAIVAEEHSSVQHVLITSEIVAENELDFATLPGLTRLDTDIAIVQHSSGSTGLQKGIALSHRAIITHLDVLAKRYEIGPQDVVVSWLPLYHDMGLIASFLLPMVTGIHIIQMSPFDWVRQPWRLLRAISDHRGTLTWMPNFAYNFCASKIRESDLEGVDISSLRMSCNGSEPAKVESHQRFYERFKPYGLRLETLVTGYGLAENVVGVSQTAMNKIPYVDEIDREIFAAENIARPAQEGRPAIKLMSCGKPLANTSVRIVDENGQDLPERHVGEIIFKSTNMLSGYYNRPELAQKAFTSDGWFKSGDYGYMLNGEVFIAGRKKDLIISGGRNIYPEDLEMLANEVPGVRGGRAVAFGIFDEDLGTEIVVLVAEVRAPNQKEWEPIANAIRQHVSMNSAATVRIVQIVKPGWVLKTTSGKIARTANRAKYIREYFSEAA